MTKRNEDMDAKILLLENRNAELAHSTKFRFD